MERRTRALLIFKESIVSVIGIVLVIVIALLAMCAPLLAPYNPIEQQLSDRYAPPTMRHLLGADEYGRDIFSRIIYGSRVALQVGILSVLFAGFIGTILGVVAGFNKGILESVIMRMADIVLSFPSLILGLLVIVAIGSGLYNLIIAISIALLPRFIRLAHAPTLALREKEFIEASRCIGCSSLRTILFHILPNILSQVIVMSTLWVATAIRIEAALSFLGLGTQPPKPSWGIMLKLGVQDLLYTPWQAVFSGFAIMFTILAFNLVGDGVRDALDPKIQT